MKLNIIFENADVLIIDKPAGLVVNRSETTTSETVQDLVGQYLKLAKGDLGVGGRAGIVHRLDRETSGVLVVAKGQKVFGQLQDKFKNREVQKEYTALVHGYTNDIGEIDLKIARVGRFGRFGISDMGRSSLTAYKKISAYQIKTAVFEKLIDDGEYNKSRLRYLKKQALSFTLLSVAPKTGRTHQIRVHLKHIGHPIVSDAIYCPNKLLKFDLSWCSRLFLHASAIELGKVGREKNLSVRADIPGDLKDALKLLTSD